MTSSGISVEPIFKRSFTGRGGLGSVASFAQVVVARLWAGIVAASDIQWIAAYVAFYIASSAAVASWFSFVRQLHSMA